MNDTTSVWHGFIECNCVSPVTFMYVSTGKMLHCAPVSIWILTIFAVSFLLIYRLVVAALAFLLFFSFSSSWSLKLCCVKLYVPQNTTEWFAITYAGFERRVLHPEEARVNSSTCCNCREVSCFTWENVRIKCLTGHLSTIKDLNSFDKTFTVHETSTFTANSLHCKTVVFWKYARFYM